MACNSLGCAGVFSVKRELKRTTGQNSWPAIQGVVMERFSVKGEIKLISSNNFIATFLIMLPSLVNVIYHVFALTGRVHI
jgi:hypothetical protein